MDIKCSECHKELTDTGKCVGCSLSPEVVHVILLRNMIRLVHSWKQMLLVPINKVEYDTTGTNEEAEP